MGRSPSRCISSEPMILIVDDDPTVAASLDLLLKRNGYATRRAASPAEALAALRAEACELVLQDMNFSRSTTGAEGLRLLAEIRGQRPELPVLLITAWGSILLAVEGMRAGAADFITKPWSNAQLLQSVATALSLAEARAADHGSPPERAELDGQFDFGAIVGRDPKLLRLLG